MLKPLHKLLLTISTVLFMASCHQTYYQVLETLSTDAKINNSNNEYESTELKVSYNFWSNGGDVYFQLTNKLDVPIYIDWSKSHLIYNGVSYDYWNDTEETNSFYSSSAVTTSNTFADAMTNIFRNSAYSSSRSSTNTSSARFTRIETSKIRPKRIIQVPPKSSVIVSKFTIDSSPFYDCKFNLKTSRKTPVNSKTFKDDETPLKFRNYITCSTNEDFTNTIVVDNNFYISTISFMPSKTFVGKSLSRNECDIKGMKIPVLYKERPYKKPSNFFIKIR